jgi:hypothetical protein
MIGVTIFGLMFTPAFYTFIRNFGSGNEPKAAHDASPQKHDANPQQSEAVN